MDLFSEIKKGNNVALSKGITLLESSLECDKITAKQVLQMPLCMIDDADKHILEGEWQTVATWEYPFKRYKLAGYNKIIKDVRGNIINFETHSLQDHFDMIGYSC